MSASKIVFINWLVTIKFYHHWLQKRGVHALFKITLGKQIRNNYALYLNINDFVVIPEEKVEEFKLAFIEQIKSNLREVFKDEIRQIIKKELKEISLKFSIHEKSRGTE